MPSSTNVPASLPERLADAEGELPEDIAKAIEAYGKAAFQFGRAFIDSEVKPTREALTATILARLTAAERCCDSYSQENQQLSDKADAALARAERAEKALKPFAEAADNLELLAKQDGSPPAVYKAVFWHSALVAARAALAHPATAEETSAD